MAASAHYARLSRDIDLNGTGFDHGAATQVCFVVSRRKIMDPSALTTVLEA